LLGLVCGLVSLAAFFLLRDSDLLRNKEPDSALVSTEGQLAFISDRDGQRDLYVMNADGSRVARLTHSEADIWHMDWSPDGRYLAYVQGRVEEADVYVLDVEAVLQGEEAAPMRVTETEGFDGYPVWSPDGGWLAFGSSARAPAGTYLIPMTDFLIAPDWSEPALWAPWVRYPAAWSPNGSRLVAETSNDLTILRADFSRIKVKGDGMRGVTLPDAQAPSWAPDGRRLVFERDGDLFVADGNGGVLSQLTDTPEAEYGPVWSPDGLEIAFLSRAQRNSDMGQAYVMPAPGLPSAQEPAPEKRRLASTPADLLAWSPDSTRLAFYSNRGRGPGVNGEIWVMNRDGTGLTVLTDHAAFDGWPLWRPTGGPLLTQVPTAQAALESALEVAESGVSHNADWTPYIREFGGMPMALVPAGCFSMGRTEADIQAALDDCRAADPDCQPPAGLEDQSPAHQVCFEQPFWIGVYEMTVIQFRDYGEKGECFNDGAGDQLPCQHTWYLANALCEHHGLRLPTEAEWEYAARGPDGLLFPWGDSFASDNLVWGASQAAEVGSKRAGESWVGALDMLGNAWEWTNTGYAPYPYSAADGREGEDGKPPDAPGVLRGHGWDDAEPALWEAGLWTAASRISDLPAKPPQPSYGFRCARSYQ
jgi:Tol biopolymer transport system component/formylglycine-generating enzyme required for sulfatase activity